LNGRRSKGFKSAPLQQLFNAPAIFGLRMGCNQGKDEHNKRRRCFKHLRPNPYRE
jgi:hypothetical protein